MLFLLYFLSNMWNIWVLRVGFIFFFVFLNIFISNLLGVYWKLKWIFCSINEKWIFKRYEEKNCFFLVYSAIGYWFRFFRNREINMGVQSTKFVLRLGILRDFMPGIHQRETISFLASSFTYLSFSNTSKTALVWPNWVLNRLFPNYFLCINKFFGRIL